ncbi:hypothetical protein [Saccharothrix sp.]|uniref:hypothetical protein n=1 Tax=Saccharothrix sp. TaxID=1873460 RepID=UPI00281275FF|nr:hypothetical protein [Saccharothrix sp.]
MGSMRSWAEHGVTEHDWTISGTLQVHGATYGLGFTARAELARFLDFAAGADGQPYAARLTRHRAVRPVTEQDRLSELDFHFDPAHGVGAALLRVADGPDRASSYWFTGGSPDGARLAATVPADIELVYDTWNPAETRFPRSSWITLPELWSAVLEWAFGEHYPPDVVSWTAVPPPTGRL